MVTEDTAKYRQIAINALEFTKGDDLHRARLRFGSMTEEELDKEYGQSGRTYRQILREYEEHEEKINKAIEWLKNL